MRKKLLGLVALVGITALPGASFAAILTTSINNVSIGSDLFNIVFSQDSDGITGFNDVFGAGAPTYYFTDSGSALAAAQAIRAAAGGAFDFTPAGASNGFVLAYASDATTFDYVTGWTNSAFNGTFGPFIDFSRATSGNSLSFAALTRVTSTSVPEPGTLALLGLGLAGMGFARRRRA